jgi:hypothetical protein
LQARQTKYAAYAATYIVIILGVLSTANVLANRYNKSYDATSNKRYSLSDQTVKIVKGLKQDATITHFAQSARFREARDQLDLYQNLSPKVHVKYVDPDKEPQVAREAGVKNYGTTVVQIGANKNEAKSLTEEGITGAFIRDLKNTTRTVCFASGSGEHQIDNSDRAGYSRFKELLGKEEYTAKSISRCRLRKCRVIARFWLSAGPAAIISNPRSRPSRNTWKVAGALCSCSIRPSRWAAPKSRTTMHSPACSRPGASPRTKISSSISIPSGRWWVLVRKSRW